MTTLLKKARFWQIVLEEQVRSRMLARLGRAPTPEEQEAVCRSVEESLPSQFRNSATCAADDVKTAEGNRPPD